MPRWGALFTLGSFLPVLGPLRQMAGAEVGPPPPGVQLLLLLYWGFPRATHPAEAGAAWPPGTGVPRVEPPWGEAGVSNLGGG